MHPRRFYARRPGLGAFVRAAIWVTAALLAAYVVGAAAGVAAYHAATSNIEATP